MNLGGEGDIARADAALPVLFFPFDLLYLDGFDLRRTPLAERLEVLARVLRPGPLLQPVQSFEADGVAAYEAAVALGFEGVVAKRRDGAYLDGRRSRQWLKVKARRSGDFVVGGWREGEGARAGSFGALLLGAYDEDGALRYVGRVGSGFSDRALAELRPRLDALAAEADPFADAPPEPARLTFVRPELVAEVEFANWTGDGRLRAPVFLRLRDDKPPSEVLREDAAAVAAPSVASPASEEREAAAGALARRSTRCSISLGARASGRTSRSPGWSWPSPTSTRCCGRRRQSSARSPSATCCTTSRRSRPGSCRTCATGR